MCHPVLYRPTRRGNSPNHHLQNLATEWIKSVVISFYFAFYDKFCPSATSKRLRYFFLGSHSWFLRFKGNKNVQDNTLQTLSFRFQVWKSDASAGGGGVGGVRKGRNGSVIIREGIRCCHSWGSPRYVYRDGKNKVAWTRQDAESRHLGPAFLPSL